MMATHRERVLEFWNERAQHGDNAGTNDVMLKELEERALVARIPTNAHILDIGCGNGSTLIRLAKEKSCSGVGLDYAERLVELARQRAREAGAESNLKFSSGSVLNLMPELGRFDHIITQRCLINLETKAEQEQAFHSIVDRLSNVGLYYMIESFNDGNRALNTLRQNLGLEPMAAPWHNLFFEIPEVLAWEHSYPVTVQEVAHFASTYYFLSRVVYAKLASKQNEELRYDSEINRLSLDLPPMGEFGATKLIVWRKAS